MHIVIAGAGEVGKHLAKMLSNEEHDLVIIDNDPDRLKAVGSALDVLTIEGNANSISHLKEAKIHKADLFIGVTFSEDVNINSAILSKRLGAKKCIARIDNQEFLLPANKELFENLGVDYMIYPEKIAAKESMVMGLERVSRNVVL